MLFKRMNIGIGITTRNRTKVLEYTLNKFKEFIDWDNTELVIVDDNSIGLGKRIDTINECLDGRRYQYIYNTSHIGIPKSKNKCLKALQHCDFVILFDDDVYPTTKQCIKNIIKRCKDKFILCENTIVLDKNIINKVGAFNDFSLYGGWEMNYLVRVKKLYKHYSFEIDTESTIKQFDIEIPKDYSYGSIFSSLFSFTEKQTQLDVYSNKYINALEIYKEL